MVKWVLSLWFAGVISGLGSDNYKIREVATRRADNVVFAMYYRPIYDNEETNRRIRRINEKYGFRNLEIRVFYEDQEQYWRLYLIPGYNRCVSDYTALCYLQEDGSLMFKFAATYVLNIDNRFGLGGEGYYWIHDDRELRMICNLNNPDFHTALRALGCLCTSSISRPQD